MNSSPIATDIGNLSIQTKIFSDNILLCLEKTTTNVDYPRFLAFLTIIADIQRNFILRYGLFLRGGITIGKLSFNEDFIFGQGLIDAVSLEENAIYPRIIIGQATLDYVLQPHFVQQSDLKQACEIESRAHSGAYISDEELAFCNSIMPAMNMEKFYSMVDQTAMVQMLDFLITFSPKDYQRLSNLSSNQKQRLEQHKARIIEKINEFGKYDNLDISKVKEAGIREHILKKYLWVLTFHNYVCMVYGISSCMIKSGSTCDVRFMRMTAEVFKDDLPGVKQQNEN